ncbi:transposase [Bernardetia litoralis DSM 6794]|uniref:Transposase n=1 Tax=Bernardetia litoralis (strain ATCC 23117 / DSM 6794 / NBRC 15988 / NCIMB 1366 / Fx l1 / Sio-4) TaxID=880071 RepID=I4AK33_BERLS|nr:IS630 family transposase [Bernardetia litoralis]AFM04318.1 transposase [Bernardetia litoralis DSM 6794]
MIFQLIDSDREILETYCSSSSGKKDYIRCTVLLSLDQGKSAKELSEILGIDLSSIYNYVKSYHRSGLSGFISSNYLGFWSKLDSFELAALDKELHSHLHKNCQSIAYWIKENLGIDYAVKSLPSLMKRLGFSYKKTKKIPAKADKIIAKDIQVLIERLDSENAVLLYSDAVHPQWNTRSNYGWIPTGEEHEIKSISGRKRINLIGTVNIQNPSDILISESETVDSLSVREFLDKVEDAYLDKSKIYSVLDQASYFKSYLVQDWVYDPRIELIYLPTYSPNLNLIERLWKFMRKKIIDYEYYNTFQKFRANLLAFFEYIDDYEDELRTLLAPNFYIQFSKTNFY